MSLRPELDSDGLPRFTYPYDTTAFERARIGQSMQFRLSHVPGYTSWALRNQTARFTCNTMPFNDEHLPNDLPRTRISQSFLCKANIESLQILLHRFVWENTGLHIDRQNSRDLIQVMRQLYVLYMRRHAVPVCKNTEEVLLWVHRLNEATLYHLVPQVAMAAEMEIDRLVRLFGPRVSARVPAMLVNKKPTKTEPNVLSRVLKLA